jgi:hypothetical protein
MIASLFADGRWEFMVEGIPNAVLARSVATQYRLDDWRPADGRPGVKLLTDLARESNGSLTLKPSNEPNPAAVF